VAARTELALDRNAAVEANSERRDIRNRDEMGSAMIAF
jgi:hypothetical protein